MSSAVMLGVGWWLGYRSGREAAPVAAVLSSEENRPSIGVGRPETALVQPIADAERSARVPVALESTPAGRSSVAPAAAESSSEGREAGVTQASSAIEGIPGDALGELGARMRLGDRLERGGDPAERLALAKEILQEGSSGPSIQALNVLFELEPDTGRTELFARLASEDPQARSVAAAAIWSGGRHEGALSAEDLAAAYELGDRDARIAAAATLEGRGDDSLARRYEEACAADFASADAEVRVRAVRDLAQRRSETSVSLLLPMLADESEAVRLEVLQSVQFGRGSAALLEALRPLQEDSSQRVSRLASDIVQRLERMSERDRDGE